ncbi:hypothetical protein [Salarchaeum sp. JOR-1]|uniref:hypothetical protein n=1 Tax=Salarchaeum sp. JOR-1 TaxID=2599399 RepID=UPI001198BEB5|nr:hypothetical protein [Salarchaeum sp. JOR-1]QDX41588.1 hypothetical protein FQU85_11990 [Salarchaeum sp. JOR-1]
MRRTALLAVALAAMLALAGCGGTGETTTAPTPNTTTTQASVDYPPGVTADGVESGFDLTGAHADALRAGNYSVNYLRTASYENGSSYESVAWTTEYGTETVYTSQSYNHAPAGVEYDTVKAWTNGSTVAFQRSAVGSSTSSFTHVSGGVDEISFVRTPGEWKEYLYTVAASGEMAVSQTDDGAFTLTYDGNSTVTVNYAGQTREVDPTTLELTVAGNGFIQKVVFEYTATIDGETVTVSELVIFQNEDVTVTNPTWA